MSTELCRGQSRRYRLHRGQKLRRWPNRAMRGASTSKTALDIGYTDGNIPYAEDCWPWASSKIPVVNQAAELHEVPVTADEICTTQIQSNFHLTTIASTVYYRMFFSRWTNTCMYSSVRDSGDEITTRGPMATCYAAGAHKFHPPLRLNKHTPSVYKYLTFWVWSKSNFLTFD
jgi:hypothetical protein